VSCLFWWFNTSLQTCEAESGSFAFEPKKHTETARKNQNIFNILWYTLLILFNTRQLCISDYNISPILSWFYSCAMTRPPPPPITTIAPNCLLGLTFPDFDLETKQEVWLLRTWFGIAPVNKLVSLTWLLWSLRSFRRFTLHYSEWTNTYMSSCIVMCIC